MQSLRNARRLGYKSRIRSGLTLSVDDETSPSFSCQSIV